MIHPSSDYIIKNYPDLAKGEAFKLASKIYGEEGLTADRIKETMASEAFKTRSEQLLGSQTQVALASQVPSLKDTSTPEEQSQVYGPTQMVYADIARGLSENYKQLGEMEHYNRVSLRNKLVSELNPTQDIDKAIFQIKAQYFADAALTHERYKNIDPLVRIALVEKEGRAVGDEVTRLLQIRKARMDKIEDEVDEKMNEQESNEKTAQLRLQYLRDAISLADKTEESRKAAAFLELDLKKAQAELDRTRRQDRRSGLSGLGASLVAPLSQEEIVAFEEIDATSGDPYKYLKKLADLTSSEFNMSAGQVNNFVARYRAYKEAQAKKSPAPVQSTREILEGQPASSNNKASFLRGLLNTPFFRP